MRTVRTRQKIADTWLNYAWWRYEQAGGSSERSVRARASARIENAERLRQHVSAGGSILGYIFSKSGLSGSHGALFIVITLTAAIAMVTIGLMIVFNLDRTGTGPAGTTAASQPQVSAPEDENIIFSEMDRELCKGVLITGNPVKIRPSPGMKDQSIGEAYASDHILYPYLGETEDDNGLRWFKIQYQADRPGWVTSELSEKSYVMPDSSDADEGFVEIAGKYTPMGAQMALIRGGRVTRLESYGWAELGHRAMNNSSAIRTASLSKIALAINAFRMQEQGAIDLNRDISEYWGFPVRNPAYGDTPITMYNLFSETSSFVYIDPSRYDLEKMTVALRDGGSYDKEHEPGKPSAWAYRNFGISVAGTTMELAATGSLLVYSEKWMREDLDMDASFAAGRLSDKSRIAAIYSPAHLETLSASELYDRKGSTEKGQSASLWAGGFTASAGDMAKLIAVLAGDGVYNGVRVLSEESVEMMETQLFTVNDQESGSTFVQATPMRYAEHIYGQTRLFYHTGNAYGVLSIAAYNPETGNGAVILTTGAQDIRDENGVYRICGELLEYAFSLVDG